MKRLGSTDTAGVVLVGSLLAGVAAQGQGREKLEGYLEWQQSDIWIVEGQRVAFTESTRFKGKDDAETPRDTPLGYEVKVEGSRRADGVLEATKVEAKKNGTAMFEPQVLDATNQLEAAYRDAGQMFQAAAGGELMGLGELHESGPRYERARRIVDTLLPPYIPSEQVRVYVVDNPEWNAMAMGNYSIYVFSGLMDDTDDDELAMVLGHEIAHASHEHTRRQQKKNMWIGLAAAGTEIALSEVDARDSQAVAGAVASLSLMAWTNGYSRDLEDQADRVGMRYAYEAGYDVAKGPGLWERFGERYGETSAMQNFFLGSHSRSSDRATNLHQQIRFNYRESNSKARRR